MGFKVLNSSQKQHLHSLVLEMPPPVPLAVRLFCSVTCLCRGGSSYSESICQPASVLSALANVSPKQGSKGLQGQEGTGARTE